MERGSWYVGMQGGRRNFGRPNKSLLVGGGMDYDTAFHIFGKLGSTGNWSFGPKNQTPETLYVRSSHPSVNAK
jgi:hypothetical protein